MKTLTLYQPWASLVAIGAKTIETRSWQTGYRGPLAIHAGKRWTQEQALMLHTKPFADMLLPCMHLPFGYIVATCDLVACIQIPAMPLHFAVDDPARYDQVILPPLCGSLEWAFGDFQPGRYAWVLSNILPLPSPIPARGAMGLWDWQAPANLEEL